MPVGEPAATSIQPFAIASTIRAKQPEAQILFAGNPKGMEAKLVPQAGFDLRRSPSRVFSAG